MLILLKKCSNFAEKIKMLERKAYQKLLDFKKDNGKYACSLMAFAASGRRLYYYTFHDDSKHRYELDFLLRRGKSLCDRGEVLGSL